MRFVCFLLVGGLLLPLASVNAQGESRQAYVRFVTLAYDLPTVDLFVDETRLVEELVPLVFTDFVPIAAGEHQVFVTAIGAPSDQPLIAPVPLTFEADTWWTVVVYGSRAINFYGISALPQKIDGLRTSAARVYFFNAMQEKRALFRLGSRELILGTSELFSRDFPIGDYEISAAPESESEANYLDISRITLQPYTSYFIAITREGETPQTVISQTNLGITLRVHHFAVDVGSVDLIANRAVVLGGINYGNPEGKITLLNGTYNLSLRLTDDPDQAPLFEARAVQLLPGMTYTIRLKGLQEFETVEAEAVIEARDAFAHNRDLLAGKNAYLTLVNVIPDDVPLDVIQPDGTVLIEGLTYDGETAVLDLPQGAYDLLVTMSGSPNSILFNLSGVTLYGGTVYDLAALGRIDDLVGGDRPIFVDSRCLLPQGCSSP